ncbi:rod shape-determining protein MreC [Ichthyenterobacterium sp. W332]|uniref:Cell shape-determining protein MreC n=1 Tax=Microcosmobacter mediterraneus TaxID=3075607 RepID=A0ABU2YM36_9FLAO|nr:rod shape-determining protein MreC [Ichthyenterobacterium sp. W332]MDT0559218.1 rod shape-determining protein MreC [Ichthyenterobacterium sp. W332]
MQQILNFIIRHKTFLMFLLLFGISLTLTIQSHSYHRSKFINSANFISGGIYKSTNSLSQFFNLKHENELLVEENSRLRALIFNQDTSIDSIAELPMASTGHYKIKVAEVFKNSYSKPNNYLLINKGANDSIHQDFGVFNAKGIIGIIDNTSSNYATVLSILNTKSRINAKLKNSNHIGSLRWNTKSPEYVQMEDVLKYAPVNVGDTIVTGGRSSIFPKGIAIGSIDSFEIDDSGDSYIVQVKLFNDMSNLGFVYIVENVDAKEIQQLENLIDE